MSYGRRRVCRALSRPWSARNAPSRRGTSGLAKYSPPILLLGGCGQRYPANTTHGTPATVRAGSRSAGLRSRLERIRLARSPARPMNHEVYPAPATPPASLAGMRLRARVLYREVPVSWASRRPNREAGYSPCGAGVWLPLDAVGRSGGYHAVGTGLTSRRFPACALSLAHYAADIRQRHIHLEAVCYDPDTCRARCTPPKAAWDCRYRPSIRCSRYTTGRRLTRPAFPFLSL